MEKARTTPPAAPQTPPWPVEEEIERAGSRRIRQSQTSGRVCRVRNQTMKKAAIPIASLDIYSLIASARGQKVILDADLAKIYDVPTKALNQAVKRNREKFPEDFLFQLTPEEAEEVRNSVQQPAGSLRSQTVTSKTGPGG